MKRSTFIILLLLLGVCATEAQPQHRGRGRRQRDNIDRGGIVYATADDGTPLKWNVFPGEGPGPHPAVLVIHGGGFRDQPRSPNTMRAARDAAEAGFNAFVPEYRLAPPGGLLGQKSAGCYPDQTNDLKKAVRAARAYPGGNGEVGGIGGSAGASHNVYLAATGTKGDDRLDAAVALSGAYDLTDPDSLAERTFRQRVENYVNSARPEDLRKASPINYVDASVSPLYVIASDDEAMPPQQFPDLIRKLKEVGATNFKPLLQSKSHQHSFSYWPQVRDRALAFLKKELGGPGGTADSRSTPARSPSSGAPQSYTR